MNKKPRGYFVFIVLILASLVISCRSIPTVKLTERDLFLSMEHDGYVREFFLHLPKEHGKLKNMPLIIALHGGGGTAKGMITLTKGRFNELADVHDFLVVYPQGLEKSWNDDRDDPVSYAHKNNIDDIGFLSSMIQLIINKYKADPARIFATGISNGGFMSFRISRELADQIKAVAPVCASIPHISRDAYLKAPTINILLLNGTSDPLVPYDGGYVQVLGKKRGRIISTDASIEVFRARNNCIEEPVVNVFKDADPEDGTRVISYKYTNRETRHTVVLLKVAEGGHTWPGGWQYLGERLIGKTSQDINACDVIWEFFSSF